MELVSFISIEDEPPDLILSFAIWQPELEDIRSLILLRTPEYEFILDETERGVKVSDEAFSDDEDDMLKEIEFSDNLVRIITNHHQLDLDLIFPEIGILGAGIATVTSWTIVAVIFGIMIFTGENDRIYAVRKHRQFDPELFRRLLKFGMPGALQFSMDVFGFTFFVFMVGRIGELELAVSNIVLSIDSLAFTPLMGFSMGTSTLVGQALGRNRPQEAVSIFVMILPIYIGIEYYGRGLYFAWMCITLFVFMMFVISFGRYVQGRWKHMRVIETGDLPPEVDME